VSEVSCALDFYEKISREHELCNRRQAALREVNELRISKRWLLIIDFIWWIIVLYIEKKAGRTFLLIMTHKIALFCIMLKHVKC